MELNDLVVIGTDHHNTLNAARSFGVNGIAPYGVIYNKNGSKNGYSAKSKFWKKVWFVSTEDEMISLILDNFSGGELKTVLFPCCDSVARIIDCHLDELGERFITPSINGQAGRIVALMDKNEQVRLAGEYGLPMAKGWVIQFGDSFEIPADMIYPCIVKPLSSYEGDKRDIKKCGGYEELHAHLDQLHKKGYKRVLVQEFLTFDYELEFVGCVTPTDDAYLISKNIRGWPVIGGTNSFFGILNDPDVSAACEKVLKMYRDMGFSGLFDVEMFYIGGRIYINEFNWRNTGNIFFSLGTGVHYAVIWYYSMIGMSTDELKHYCTDESQFAMNELTDVRHVFSKNIKWKEWNRDRKKTGSFSLWYKGDMKPTLIRYSQMLRKLFFKR